MKFSAPFPAILLLCLWMCSSQADISLKLRNTDYLPPTHIQQLSIKEDCYNTPDNIQQQHKFEENNYANDKYQIFEVHNPYKHLQGNDENGQKSSSMQINHGSVVADEQIRFEHINTPNDFSLHNANLDISYMSFATGNDGNNKQFIVHHEPTKSNNIPSKFQQSYAQQSNSQIQKYSSQLEQNILPIQELQTTHLNYIKNFKSPDYLPPEQHGLKQLQQNSLSKGPDFLQTRELPLNPYYQAFESNSMFKGPDYLPPSAQGSLEQNTASKGLNYFPPKQYDFEKSDYSTSQTNFMGSNYLPPQQQHNVQQENNEFRQGVPFNSPEPLTNSHEKNHNTVFKSPGYLPPQNQPKEFNPELNESFKGPDYLPPNRLENNAAFKGSTYSPTQENHIDEHSRQIPNLPHGYDFQKPPNAEQAIEELHKLPEEIPNSEIQLSVHDECSNLALDIRKEGEADLRKVILPTGYDFQKPKNSEQAINLLHSQETTSIKDSKHILPVYHFQRSDASKHTANQLQNTDSSEQGFNSDVGSAVNSFLIHVNAVPDIGLLQGQQNSDDKNQAQVSGSRQSFQGEFYNNLRYLQQAQPEAQSEVIQISKSSLQPFEGADYLPPSTVSQTFKAAEYLPPTTETEVFKGPEYMPPTNVHLSLKDPIHNHMSEEFKGPDYLPPPTDSHNYNSPDYLPPVAAKPNQKVSEAFEQQSQFKGPDYLPPSAFTTTQSFKPIIMYSLSSYMPNIKPNDRYGNSKPFLEYEVPTTKTIGNNISPLYQEAALKPLHYAPAASYNKRAYGDQTSTTFKQDQYTITPTFSQQALHTLETFMPEHIRQQTTTVMGSVGRQSTQPGNAKMRTVNILNSNAIKTLRVLESLDHAGIKTIHILSSTNEQPVGDYRIVKVVSGSKEQTVQIFNDHQDVPPNENGSTMVGLSNSYLPSRRKRNPDGKKKIRKG